MLFCAVMNAGRCVTFSSVIVSFDINSVHFNIGVVIKWTG